MSPLLPLHLMPCLSASKRCSLLSILTLLMATEPLDAPTHPASIISSLLRPSPLCTTSNCLSPSRTPSKVGCASHPNIWTRSERLNVYGVSGKPNFYCLSVVTMLIIHRFTSEELHILADALDLPNPLITEHGYDAPEIKVMGLICAQLHSPED